ncbi:MAG: nickel pincer cofactor biosynthesis protein LarB [Methanolinea sp.]|jgi:hypothetical protein|nr:nickel pincer cofactor biosynthesis protein LarB [Methanolinea sp.]
MPSNHRVEEVLSGFKEGRLTLKDAVDEIVGLRIEIIGNLANLDMGRSARCGVPEVMLAEGKSPSQVAEIARKAVRASGRIIVSRISSEHLDAVRTLCQDEGFLLSIHEDAAMAVISTGPSPELGSGVVAIITAGTSDIRVAEEARVIAGEMGCRVKTAYDVGAAGIHRLFPALKECLGAHVYIVAAGREGTLPAVVAGLVDCPVIGVPVSTGYGYMGQGRAALASMLQSCSVIAVVNIDAGFVAGAFAAQIANMVGER